ncbi:hypothetical protein KP509_09G022600 [Ceratopteris richardii]|uniref:F-box domain-containing protein n=1 Tax=Ceratopteris richardii TaxID=49495 RepID=A0A8T2U301_CERRI|nr:hypothetical protein KP509_09G022600 [Ceratopteris richardii]
MEELPKEVLGNILSRLSTYDVVRVASTCRAFKALVASEKFPSSCSSVSLLLLLHSDNSMRLSSEFPPSTAWTYDVDRDAWLNLSLDFLQPHSPDFAYPVASDGGLICFGSGRDFITCNPITKSWRRLPYLSHTEQEFMEHSVQAFGLSYKPAADGYDFFVLNCSDSDRPSVVWLTRGTLYMLGGVGAIWLEENVWVRPTTVRIWKLQGQNNAWTEITRMPAPILHDFCRRIDFDELQCWGKNGVLYMKSLASDILMYNLSVNQWSWTKEVPAFVETLALIFEPSLSASA